MRTYRADLHIHTLLSPCGDLRMSPDTIISMALKRGLDIIGITDHNSTRQSELVKMLGSRKWILVLQGAEVTTKEEVHCLAFFENPDMISEFQALLDISLPDIKNDPLIFGDQVVVDENEDIIYVEEKLLTNATNLTLKELEEFVHDHDGLFIPAHIDRMKNSIYSQLGFLPGNLNADALEVSKKTTPSEFSFVKPEIRNYSLLSNSDAHFPESIGMVFNELQIEKPTFGEVRMALGGLNGRNTGSRC
jgi:PHP family Zn ribbon phosphoesterase